LARFSPSISEVTKRVASGEINCEERIASRVSRLPRLDRDVHAFLFTAGEGAIERARAIDRKVKRGEKVGKLAGVTIAIKDNICVKGMPATCASKILEGFAPPYNATVVERILAEDGIILGKTSSPWGTRPSPVPLARP
jgi:aspartyl-tRNA(Asn)/glutamyl-tRNA(Gln) amidotransferase subunit A